MPTHLLVKRSDRESRGDRPHSDGKLIARSVYGMRGWAAVGYPIEAQSVDDAASTFALLHINRRINRITAFLMYQGHVN